MPSIFTSGACDSGRRHDQVTGAILIGNGALILFALGAEMGERVAALAGAGLAVFVLIRAADAPQRGGVDLQGRARLTGRVEPCIEPLGALAMVAPSS